MRGFNSLPGGAGGGQGGEAPDCGTCIKNAWNNVPAFNRFIMIFPTVIYLMTFLMPNLAYYIACIPILVYGNFECKSDSSLTALNFNHVCIVWRVMTGIWCHPQLLMLLFALFSYVQHGVREEKRIGTVAFFFRFLLISTLTLILFVAVCGISGFGVMQPAAGLWAMLFADLVIEAMVEPDQPRP